MSVTYEQKRDRDKEDRRKLGAWLAGLSIGGMATGAILNLTYLRNPWLVLACCFGGTFAGGWLGQLWFVVEPKIWAWRFDRAGRVKR